MTVRDQLVYEFGPVRIDASNRKLLRDGESVHIQARGLDALLLLVQRRNEVVSKAELLATIWPDIHVEESSLPVMISAYGGPSAMMGGTRGISRRYRNSDIVLSAR